MPLVHDWQWSAILLWDHADYQALLSTIIKWRGLNEPGNKQWVARPVACPPRERCVGWSLGIRGNGDQWRGQLICDSQAGGCPKVVGSRQVVTTFCLDIIRRHNFVLELRGSNLVWLSSLYGGHLGVLTISEWQSFWCVGHVHVLAVLMYWSFLVCPEWCPSWLNSHLVRQTAWSGG